MSDVMHETAMDILEKKRAQMHGSDPKHEDDDKDIISILRGFFNHLFPFVLFLTLI